MNELEKPQLFVWDGTETSLTALPRSLWHNIAGGVLRFPLRLGNGSIAVGGWLIIFRGNIVAFGYE